MTMTICTARTNKSGNIRFGSKSGRADKDKFGTSDARDRPRYASALLKAEGHGMRSMFSRMGREEDPARSAWNPAA